MESLPSELPFMTASYFDETLSAKDFQDIARNERRGRARQAVVRMLLQWQEDWPEDLQKVRISLERRHPHGNEKHVGLNLSAEWRADNGKNEYGHHMTAENLVANRHGFYDAKANRLLLPLAQAALDWTYDCGELHQVFWASIQDTWVTQDSLAEFIDKALGPDGRAAREAHQLRQGLGEAPEVARGLRL